MSTPFDEAPYLQESPRVVPVGEARQLFNDDYLILWSRSVARVHHRFAEVVRLEFEGDALLTAPPDLFGISLTNFPVSTPVCIPGVRIP